MSKYILSPNAARSLENIGEYSLEWFGKKQTITYLNNLQERMRHLAANPKPKTRNSAHRFIQ